MVETVRWDDVDGDERPEVVVIIRSPGSGGYVSANALSYQSGSIELFEAIPNVGKRRIRSRLCPAKFKHEKNFGARHNNRQSEWPARAASLSPLLLD